MSPVIPSRSFVIPSAVRNLLLVPGAARDLLLSLLIALLLPQILEAQSAGAGAGAGPPDTTITITASSSTLAFEPTDFTVKAGKRVLLRFVNAGTLPHNFVLVRHEDDIDDLAMAATQEGGNYVPKDMKDKLLAFTTLASPNQTVEVAFTAPAPGLYTYVCLMSGHAAMMLGKLRSVR